MKAHPTALVDPAASVAEDAEIGPFCVVGPGVRLGAGCRLGPRVTIYGTVAAGRDNVFRESSHVDAATGATTRIGSRNRLGAWAGILSGGTVGSEVHIGAFSAVGENGIVEDGAWIEGQCMVDANRRVGRASLIRAQVPVSADVPPFMCLDGNPSAVSGVNPNRTSAALEGAFDVAFKGGLAPADAAKRLLGAPGASPEVAALAEFLRTAKPPEAAGE